MKKGFTLIELLVVVLIIGILAAIALPQYTKAVEKSRRVEAITLLKSLRDQQQICFMQYGDGADVCSYKDDNNNLFTVMDIDIPGTKYTGAFCPLNYCPTRTKNFVFGASNNAIVAYNDKAGYGITTSANPASASYNKMICSDEADDACKKAGAKIQGSYWSFD
ncbi:prepilin-type N-terminal cleavage/methylation domain-containing protein [Elusimicrobium posterum]|uniref:type IV pilin protein n=1 Tax=Elusimicrobium posterum TaxID=3116653 RepID=UPI003C75507C